MIELIQCSVLATTVTAYVALSRATKLETLQVLNFNQRLYVWTLSRYAYRVRKLTNFHCRVQAHPRVLEWYDKILDEDEEARNKEMEMEMDDEEAISAYWGNT